MGRPKGRKSLTKLKSESLKQEIYDDILAGVTRKKIIAKLMNGEYESQDGVPYKDSMAYKMSLDAYDVLEIELAEKRNEQRKLFYERYMDLYAEARRSLDRQTALNVLKEVAKMMGINEPEEVRHTMEGEITINFGENYANQLQSDADEEPGEGEAAS